MNTKMTSDARSALDQTAFSRRTMLRGTGMLVVAFTLGDIDDAPLFTGVGNAQINGRGAAQDVDSWIAVAASGEVTAYTGKCEIGQGLFTAQTQLVAEELDVPPASVRLITCDTARTPDQGVTSGAQSHPANFNRSNLAQAAATAREALLALAARRLGVPAEQLTLRAGVISAGDSTRAISYGELIGGAKFMLPLNPSAKRKHPTQWSVLGTSVPRLDMAAMVTAKMEYVHNLRLQGMLHGRVVRPPAVGSTLSSVDESSVRDMPGFVAVVRRKNFLGVVAHTEWHAIQIASKLKVAWAPGRPLPAQDTFYHYLRTQPSRDTVVVDSGDLDATLRTAVQIFKSTYVHPYQSHGSIGASCGVADVKEGAATIWSATQGVYMLRDSAALLLGLAPDKVHVVYVRGSGCYGINGADTASFDAALLSQAVGRPVRVQLTRKDEMAWENFGSPFVIDQRAGVDDKGNIVGWEYEGWSATRGGRPGYTTPGNLITGFLAGHQPQHLDVTQRLPPPPAAFSNNGNAAPSYVTGCAGGACGGTGTIQAERVLSHVVASPLFTGPLRSPSRLQNTFAHESFIDELAFLAKADPRDYRLRHIRDPRLKEVITAATQLAKWDTRPSPARRANRSAIVEGRGMSCVLYEGDNGYAAMVVNVDVNTETGAVVVKRMSIAMDVGPISNPDGLKNQAEGGALQGMSRAMMEEVTWDSEKVTSTDWRTYKTFSLGADIPQIETVLIPRPDERASGAGETTITIVAAALGNAIFDATGVRIREVPFTVERIRAALANPPQ